MGVLRNVNNFKWGFMELKSRRKKGVHTHTPFSGEYTTGVTS